MPITPVYGFHFEDADDQPGISLTGGEAGTELILAEQVEDELQNIQGGVNDIGDRVTEIEDNGILGWTYINHGTASGASFVIDLTKGGAFGAGDFDLLRLHMRYDLDGIGWVGLRINSVAEGKYRDGGNLWEADGQLGEAFFAVQADQWRVGFGSTNSNNTLICEIVHTNGDNFMGYQSNSARPSTDIDAHRYGNHWGVIRETIGAPPSSLRLAPLAGAAAFANAWFWVEGFRVPA